MGCYLNLLVIPNNPGVKQNLIGEAWQSDLKQSNSQIASHPADARNDVLSVL
jgi:hypothetical protein